MGGIIEIAGAMLQRADWRMSVSAQNIANITTPGYKSGQSFEGMISRTSASGEQGSISHNTGVDWSDGKLVASHNNLDLAVSGNGFFMVRQAGETFYTRAGRFSRDAGGYLVTPTGARLQGNGGDIVVTGAAVTVDPDGTVHDTDKSTQQVALADFADKSALTDAGEGLYRAREGTGQVVASPDIRQGMVEASNVSDSGEMSTIMSSLRSAEAGQKIGQLYDDLMTQAATSFGQGAG